MTNHTEPSDVSISCSGNFCCTVHTLGVPFEDGCLSTYVGLINGLVLLFMFVYVLRKIFSSNRRSRAGYTKNTVSLDTHVTLLEGVLVWTVGWGLFQVFSFKDGTADLPPPFLIKKSRVTSISTTCLIYGSSEAFMVLILALLVSDSMGKNNLRWASFASGFYGVAVALSIGFVMVYAPGSYNENKPSIPANVNLVMIFVSAFDAIFMMAAVIVTKRVAPERKAVRRFAYFQGAVSCCLIVARMLSFRMPMEKLHGVGLCMLDLTLFIYFLMFAPVIYMTLKRDSAYWMYDNDDDDERRALTAWGDQTLIEELPVFEDVVIPKTELYLRKRLEDRIDTCIEVHLWRRTLVVVKRFKLDFLTRDNIKLFKKEAAINRKLAHENVVRFLGVVIDPPCMSIIMEYGSRGDLFSYLKHLTEKIEEERRSSSFASFGSSNLPGEAADTLPDMPVSGFGSSFNPIRCLLGIATGMRYLHSHDMVHCDLKTANVVLDADLNAKITDFGDVEEAVKQADSRSSTFQNSSAARSFFSGSGSNIRLRSSSALVSRLSEEDISGIGRATTSSRRGRSDIARSSTNWGAGSRNGLGDSKVVADMKYGTVPWAAPELVVGTQEPSFSSDAFSFGMIMWELVTWKVPFFLVARLQERMDDSSHLNSSVSRSSTGSISSFDTGEPNGLLPSQLHSVSSDVFSTGKRPNRRERDRRANLQSDTAVLSLAGEISTSSHRRRMQQESPLMSGKTRGSASSMHSASSSTYHSPFGVPPSTHNSANAAAWAQRLLAVDRARTLVPIDDSAVSGDSLTIDVEAEPSGAAEQSNHDRALGDVEAGEAGSTEPELTSPLLYNRSISASITSSKHRFPSMNADDMSSHETSNYHGAGGGSSWNSRRGGVQAVEVTTPDEACELMCMSRYRPPLPVRLPTAFVTLMRQCWKQDREERPDFATIVNKLEAIKYAQNNLDPSAKVRFPCGIANFANYDDN